VTPGLFVTGTDTGVGKTVVSAGLLRLLTRAGRRPVPFKPVETGCRRGVPADARALRDAAARTDIDIRLVCPITFLAPVAPAAASPRARPIRRSDLLAAFRRLRPLGDCFVVEGAGGLLSPYAARLTAADLARMFRLPLLLVARNALGTINHTALAIAEIERQALPFAGYVLVTTRRAPNLARQHNAELIERMTGHAPLAVLPHLERPTPDRVARELARRLRRPLII
jgi:dethiobiotin synthetase